MLTEKQIDMLVERIAERIRQANTFFLIKMGENIKKFQDISFNEAWKLQQILRYGGNYEEILNELQKYTQLNIKDIDDIFMEFAKKDYDFAEEFYKFRNMKFIPLEENKILRNQVKALATISKGELANFSKSSAIGYTIRDLTGKMQFMGLRETYNRVLDEAILNVGQGKETFNNSMARIMEELGGSGLKTVDFASGRSVRLDSVARMNLQSGLRNLHNELQKQIGEDIGADGVEISVHENPADDHEDAQGQQFSKEEYQKLQTDGRAKTYKGKTITLHKKGENFRPISELNCYHYVFSIILGISEPQYSKSKLKKIKERNNDGFTFEDKHYSMYEGTQLQRRYESAIRTQKDIQILAKKSGNNELILKSQNNITKLTNKYNDLCKISGLSRKADRLRVKDYKRVAKSKLV